MSSPLEASLSSIEAQLQDTQAALVATDPLSLEHAATRLREAAAAFAQALADAPARDAWPEAARQRVQAVAAGLGLLRDQLARVMVLTERQAASLLPPLEGVTYGKEGIAPTPVGARIYRSPG